MEIWANAWNGPSKYIIIVIAVIMIAYIPWSIIYLKKKKKDSQQFLANNPTAAKVFTKSPINASLVILAVNGEKPTTFFEKAKLGVYLLPGDNTLNVQYSSTRPGVMYKTVTTTVGPNDITVTPEPNGVYNISYDTKEETYKFKEVPQ